MHGSFCVVCIHIDYYCMFILLTDGHHKLMRWRFVTHGGIDGYSRLIVFLQCSCNNTAATVVTLFEKAVQQHGLPSREIRSRRRKYISCSVHVA